MKKGCDNKHSFFQALATVLIWEDYPILWKESFQIPSVLRLEHNLPGESVKTDTKKGCNNKHSIIQALATVK